MLHASPHAWSCTPARVARYRPPRSSNASRTLCSFLFANDRMLAPPSDCGGHAAAATVSERSSAALACGAQTTAHPPSLRSASNAGNTRLATRASEEAGRGARSEIKCGCEASQVLWPKLSRFDQTWSVLDQVGGRFGRSRGDLKQLQAGVDVCNSSAGVSVRLQGVVQPQRLRGASAACLAERLRSYASHRIVRPHGGHMLQANFSRISRPRAGKLLAKLGPNPIKIYGPRVWSMPAKCP